MLQALFELFKNEEDLIEDLNMVKTVSFCLLCFSFPSKYPWKKMYPGTGIFFSRLKVDGNYFHFFSNKCRISQ